jgi:MFS family permease
MHHNLCVHCVSFNYIIRSEILTNFSKEIVVASYILTFTGIDELGKNEPKTTTKRDRRGIFASRNFIDYTTQYLTSRSAFQVASVGLIWIVYAVTRSALDIAIVGVANTVSTLIVTLPAGVWIDRLERRMLLVVSNAVSVACVALLTLLSVTRNFDIVLVVSVVVVWAAFGELYRSTAYAVLPDIVRANELPNANGITQSGFQIVNSISTVLGGGLIAIAGAALAFVYGAAGYGLAALFSGFLLYRFRANRGKMPIEISPVQDSTTNSNGQGKESATTRNRNMGKEIKEGFSWLVTQRGLFAMSLLALVFNFLFGIPTYFLVIYVTNVLNAGALLYGGILAAFAAGAAAGSLIAGRIASTITYAGKIIILFWGAAGGSLLALLGLFPSATVALSAVLGIGFVVGVGNNVWLTSAQNLVPTEMRGRYFAIDGLLSFVGGPPSIAVGGILITLIGISQVFELSAGLLLVFTLIFALIKSLWTLDGRAIQTSSSIGKNVANIV